MKVVFMGTPVFAVPSLEKLSSMREIQVAGVFTQPDRPKGRGYQTEGSPVKAAAEALKLPIFQPETIKEPKVLDCLQQWNPDIIVVVAYGLILPENVLQMPKHGCINVHASLLPEYRGAAPIQQCLIDGASRTGITTMLMEKGMDTGPILLQNTLSIALNETAETLHDKLAIMGADTLEQTIHALLKGTLVPKLQDHRKASYAPRLTKESGRIDWCQSAREIDCLVRGTQPWPTAYTTFRGRILKIWKTTVEEGRSQLPPGTIVATGQQGITVSTGSGCVVVTELQTEGKRKMSADEFLRGNNLQVLEMLGV